MGFSVLGTGSGLPSRIVTNHELARHMDTSDEWISTRTGIRQRPVCAGETVGQLAVQAAQAALENAGVTAQELDLILCPTLGGDFVTPALACQVQQGIGAHCPAMDLNAACTGFLYALDVADAYFARGHVSKVLVVAAEAMSHFVDWEDRATCVLFGDGAAAVVLGQGNDLLAIRLTCQGDPAPLSVPRSGGNSPFSSADSQRPYLRMNGQDIYKFAVNAICRDIALVTKEAGIAPEQLDHLVLHQANLRILEAGSRRLGVPREKVALTIDHTGNLCAASVPMALDELNRAGRLCPGQLVALGAFGAGLTTGACVLRWSRPAMV